MTKREYMTRFSRAARWFLPLEEAAVAVADYHELFSEGGRSETDVCYALGDPVKAASLLRDAKRYRVWMAVFCLLTLCAAQPFFWCLSSPSHYWPRIVLDSWVLEHAFPGIVGVSIALIWFRRKGEHVRAQLPKKLLLTMGGLLLVAVLAGVAVSVIFVNALSQEWAGRAIGSTVLFILQSTVTLSFLAGMTGLVKARTSDRRWRALYLLGLDLILVCAAVIAMLTNMNIDSGGSCTILQDLSRIGAMGLVGLAATGVSLC